MNEVEARQRVEGVMLMRCPRMVPVKKRSVKTQANERQPLNLPSIAIDERDGFEKQPWEFLKSRATESTIDLAFIVPRGYSCRDLKQETDSLYAALGAHIQIIDRAGVVQISIARRDFPDSIPFDESMLSLTTGREILCGFDILGNPLTHNFRVPHLLIGSQSGYGKTDFVRLMIYQLISRFTPEELWIDIIDGKGFSFMPFRGIPHIRRIGRDLAAAYTIMKDAQRVMRHRSDAVWEKWDRDETKKFQWRIVIVDELYVISPAAQVTKENKLLANDTYAHMAEISCVGREASVGVIMATQRPDANVVHPQVKQNCDVSIALKCKTLTNSEIILDRGGAELLPHNIPGRAIYSGKQETHFQIPYVGGDSEWEKLLAPYRKETPKNEPIETRNNPHDIRSESGYID